MHSRALEEGVRRCFLAKLFTLLVCCDEPWIAGATSRRGWQESWRHDRASDLEFPMQAKSPLQRVKAEHGSKTELAKKLLPLLERYDEESDDEFSRRLRTSSNKQLLRLWDTQQRLKSEFGTKSALVDAIVELRFGKANADYRAKLETFRITRLLDLHRQLSVKAKRAG